MIDGPVAYFFHLLGGKKQNPWSTGVSKKTSQDGRVLHSPYTAGLWPGDKSTHKVAEARMTYPGQVQKSKVRVLDILLYLNFLSMRLENTYLCISTRR